MSVGNVKRGISRAPGQIDEVEGVIYIPPDYDITYLIVAGGGGGADGLNPSNYMHGGGGGGGVLPGTKVVSSGEIQTIVVGAGGALQTKGGNSSLNELIAIGGGKATRDANGGSGGSGGGGTGTYPDGFTSGGAGTPGQGYNGGNGYGIQDYGTAEWWNGGGGGGAGEPGHNGSSINAKGGDGGDGLLSSITGTDLYYGGGGGGGCVSAGAATAGKGGKGGGGRGTKVDSGGTITPGTNGSANTGGGGGCDSVGGSGVVILKMLTTDYTGIITGSPVVTVDGDYTVLKFLNNGTYTA